MAQREIGDQKSSLVLFARFPVVKLVPVLFVNQPIYQTQEGVFYLISKYEDI